MEQEQEAREELRGYFWKEKHFKAGSGHSSPGNAPLASYSPGFSPSLGAPLFL